MFPVHTESHPLLTQGLFLSVLDKTQESARASFREVRPLGVSLPLLSSHQLSGSHLWDSPLVTRALNGSICCEHFTPAPDETDKEIWAQLRKPAAEPVATTTGPRGVTECLRPLWRSEGRKEGKPRVRALSPMPASPQQPGSALPSSHPSQRSYPGSLCPDHWAPSLDPFIPLSPLQIPETPPSLYYAQITSKP